MSVPTDPRPQIANSSTRRDTLSVGSFAALADARQKAGKAMSKMSVEDVGRFAGQHRTAIAEREMAERIAATYAHDRIDPETGEVLTFVIDPADMMRRLGSYGRTVSTDDRWTWDEVSGDAVATVLPVVKSRANGRPTNWTDALPPADAPERSHVRIGRNKRGTTRQVTRHGRTMVTYEGVRMSTTELAAIATETVRLACGLCQAVREACPGESGDGHDSESGERVCRKCVKGCECMPDVLGGDRLAWQQVIHAGNGASCAVASAHSTVLEAYGDVLSTLSTDERAEARETYVSQTVSERGSVAAKGSRTADVQRWPVRFGLPALNWRKSERAVSFGLSTPMIGMVDRHDKTAIVIDEPTLVLLPAVDDNGGRFQGHVHHSERGALADRKARGHDNGARDQARAIAAGRLASEVAANMIAVGESTVVEHAGQEIRVDRLASTTYRVTGSEERKRTLTAAIKLAHKVADAMAETVPAL